MDTKPLSTEHAGPLAGLHASWQIVQHGSSHHVRLHLANLQTARAVCLHITQELDRLIKMAEAKLAEYDDLESSVSAFEKTCAGRSSGCGH
jgi:hypothetical protein